MIIGEKKSYLIMLILNASEYDDQYNNIGDFNDTWVVIFSME